MEPLKPLQELARTLRAEGLHEHNGQDCAETDAADRILSLLPALEAAFAVLKNGPTHAEVFQSGRNSRDKEVAALKEPMSCGHPKACEVISAETGEILYCGWCNAVSMARDSMTDKMLCGHERACAWPEGVRCTACEQARLERAAALRPMADIAGRIKKYFSCVGSGEQALKFADEILALIPPADQKALDAHDVERDQRWIDAFGGQDLVPRVTPESLAKWVFRDVEQQLDGLEHEKAEVRDRMLEEVLHIASLSSHRSGVAELIKDLGKLRGSK